MSGRLDDLFPGIESRQREDVAFPDMEMFGVAPAPQSPRDDESWAVPEAATAARRSETRRRFSASFLYVVLVHVAVIVAAVLLQKVRAGSEAPQPIGVDLVREMPKPTASSPSGGTQQQQQSSPQQTPPPNSHPPALRKPPPEPSADHAATQNKTASPSTPPTEAPPSPNGELPAAAPSIAQNADPSTALPFFSMPGAFDTNILQGAGPSTTDSYKGVVFGRIGQAHPFAGATPPRETGQAVVSFTVGDDGAIVAISLAQSSGFSDLDAEALRMIRSVAPFPPPPAGAERSFAAAIDFGQQ